VCGLVGVATVRGRTPSVDRAGLAAMRDRLAHRGPDGDGLWMEGAVGLGHRRLAVVGPGEGGAQPLVSPCGRHVLVYNGELYNDAEVRAALRREGRGQSRPLDGLLAEGDAQGACDTPTVLAALMAWGTEGLARLRGMFALAWYDASRDVVTLARDPLGIKPLLVWRGHVPGGGEEVVFASEVGAILAHPHFTPRPDFAVVSSYITTIRRTLGSRTMFDGIRVVRPGEWIALDLSGERIAEKRGSIPLGAGLIASRGVGSGAGRLDAGTEPDEAFARTREIVGDSVRRHLRSDAPLCALLSGGLDSTIVCAETRRHVDDLQTFCTGAIDAGGGGSPDFEMARLAAVHLGTAHTERAIDRGAFLEQWPWMVGRLGLPLSTPNEVGIHGIAVCLRERGNVVALSGEGADELFGGYDRPLASAWRWIEGGGRASSLGEFVLADGAWVPTEAKSRFLRPAFWEAIERDAAMVETYRDGLGECVADAGARGWRGHEALMQAVLGWHRRVNLVGLLERLDGATMLAGVEGRTPLADAGVAAWAEGLPVGLKFSPVERAEDSTHTKIALRRAFAAHVPEAILNRPKASFPLPFQTWMRGAVGVLDGSTLVESLFEPAAVAMVRHNPELAWGLAWPMLNLAMWGRRWGW
ncbi:MAG: asparagine synthase (glutamine-hydrolyzing), partial [Phycisphaerales bacterium]|nr:asparagine synthase (glutamine-hydrolyzing) [Phycisphaerales bacterium]